MPKFYALIVGVDEYQDEEFRNLDGTVRDARRMAAFFRERMAVAGGYRASEVNVVLLENPTSQEVREQFAAMVNLLEEDSVFVFYFAGHGLCFPGAEFPSLLCSDAMDALLDGAVGAGEITPQFIRAKSRTGIGDMLFIFDVSRAGLNMDRGVGRRVRSSGRRCRLSSCSAGEFANDDGSFVDAMLAEWDESLEAGEGLAVGSEYASRVSQRLAKKQSRQHPEIEGVSIALTPNGKKDGFNVVRALRSASAPPKSAPVDDEQLSPEESTSENQARMATPVLSEDFASAESNAEAERILTEASKKSENAWANSPSRKAGTRQTLKIGNVEYGFCWIPAGEFDMGSPESEKERLSDERLHHVKLTKGFWMLETETTQALYREVMGRNPSDFKGDNLPVENVSWYDALKFCTELTKRLPEGLTASLPTEAQWEYACRAGTKTAYSFGDSLNGDNANCNGNYPYGTTSKGKSLEKTSPVKSYAPNPWGLYDMHGNVWEWCLDYYGEYPTGTVVDPLYPNSAWLRVIRGGDWSHYARNCRSASRDGDSAGNRDCYFGFRVLLSCD